MNTSAAITRLYSSLVEDEEDHGCKELPESSCQEVPANAGKLVTVFTLTKVRDRIVDLKITLAWLLTSLAAPAFTIALLAPLVGPLEPRRL